MDDIINLDDARRDKLVKDMVDGLSGMISNAEEVADEFFGLAMRDATAAIKQFPEWMQAARDAANPNKVPDALVGGPCEYVTAPMLNILGIPYPYLPREARKEALIQALGFLDLQRYDLAQDNVEYISEPWLVGDITLNRPLYWCGYKEYTKWFKEIRTWERFIHADKKPKSDFWCTFTLLQPEYASLDVRENFYKHFAELVDRTLDMAGGRYFYKSKKWRKEGLDVEEKLQEKLSRYDPQFHDKIREKMVEPHSILLPDAEQYY